MASCHQSPHLVSLTEDVKKLYETLCVDLKNLDYQGLGRKNKQRPIYTKDSFILSTAMIIILVFTPTDSNNIINLPQL